MQLLVDSGFSVTQIRSRLRRTLIIAGEILLLCSSNSFPQNPNFNFPSQFPLPLLLKTHYYSFFLSKTQNQKRNAIWEILVFRRRRGFRRGGGQRQFVTIKGWWRRTRCCSTHTEARDGQAGLPARRSCDCDHPDLKSRKWVLVSHGKTRF